MNAKKILILEDEVIVGYDLKEFLESLGYSVALAHDPDSAMILISEFIPDLCICDINLGTDINGIEFIKQAKTILPHLGVIFATAFSNYMMKESAKETEALYYIVKPWNEDQIKITVKSAFEHISK